MDKWQKLMVRIRKDDVSVYIDCVEVATGKLSQGKIEQTTLSGLIGLAQEVTPNAFGGASLISNSFDVSINSFFFFYSQRKFY